AELEQERDEIDDGEHQQAKHDLQRTGPHQEAEQRVEHVRDDEDLEQVTPARRRERQLPERHYGPPRAEAKVRASRAAATSCTRKMRAPRSQASAHAAAVARSRACTGWPVTAPRNRLRDGPTTTGWPSACSASS